MGGAKKVVDGEVKNVTIVDLRSPEDFKKGHIPGAINIANIKEDEIDFPGLRKDGYNYLYGYLLSDDKSPPSKDKKYPLNEG